jgi:hypothetical protein
MHEIKRKRGFAGHLMAAKNRMLPTYETPAGNLAALSSRIAQAG